MWQTIRLLYENEESTHSQEIRDTEVEQKVHIGEICVKWDMLVKRDIIAGIIIKTTNTGRPCQNKLSWWKQAS